MKAPNFADQARFEQQDDVVLPDDVIDGVSQPKVAVYRERSTGSVYQVFRNAWFRKGSCPVIDSGGHLNWDEW